MRKGKRRRSRQLHTLFEPLACDVHGNRVFGTAYRRGSALMNDAMCYQFRRRDVTGREDSRPAAGRVGRQFGFGIRDLMLCVLTEEEIDLMDSLVVHGMSQVEFARMMGVKPYVVNRRFKAALKKLRRHSSVIKAILEHAVA